MTIYYRRRLGQLIDFSEMKFGDVTPTDFDGFLDFHGYFFVFIEVKGKGVPLPTGQKLAFENLAASCKQPMLCIVCEHDFPRDTDIKLVECYVTDYYYGGYWRTPAGKKTVWELIKELVPEKYYNKLPF